MTALTDSGFFVLSNDRDSLSRVTNQKLVYTEVTVEACVDLHCRWMVPSPCYSPLKTLWNLHCACATISSAQQQPGVICSNGVEGRLIKDASPELFRVLTEFEGYINICCRRLSRRIEGRQNHVSTDDDGAPETSLSWVKLCMSAKLNTFYKLLGFIDFLFKGSVRVDVQQPSLVV